jgi:hypothetical protein
MFGPSDSGLITFTALKPNIIDIAFLGVMTITKPPYLYGVAGVFVVVVGFVGFRSYRRRLAPEEAEPDAAPEADEERQVTGYRRRSRRTDNVDDN